MTGSATIGKSGLAPFERETLLDAFLRNAHLRWTPEGLASWYGIQIDRVRGVLDELVDDGIVRRAPGLGDGYVLNERPVSVKFLPPQPSEFVCARCHLIKHRRQLRDSEKMLCRDCV
ncbi:MAG: DUF4193 family protein [Actinomycetota bacterium]